ncbi:beta-glucan synthesis-associated protein [Thraustotheca clavata]|uniref:Beta-glucan synthesis-associated protein n=1 Tax=Thraustotheca clavata TaxID=74557 RepID=A0A1W0A631_9STRA|nr:beta-glucan synthesis-associated protein [Thraustotheca clavata]
MNQAVSFRVLLSNDAVYRFHCLPTHQIRVILDHILEIDMTMEKQMPLYLCRLQQVLDGHEIIGDVLIEGDLLTIDVNMPTELATTVCLDMEIAMPDINLYPQQDVAEDEIPIIERRPSREYIATPTTIDTNDVNDTDRWRKAHVSRIEANGVAATINLSPLEIEHNTRISHHDLMLHAALQLTENALKVQHELRLLYLHFRSQQSTSSAMKEGATKVLSLIRSTDRRPIFLHPNMNIAMHGYVDCGKWGALWRTKQRCWAVLWDAKLSFFSSPEGARKYMFALANDRRCESQVNDDIGKRIQKEYAPHTEFNLTGWSVRPGAQECKRHTFALFDETGSLRQVVDLTTKAETDAWVRAIALEAQQHLVRLQAKLKTASAIEYLQLLRLTGEDGSPILPLTPPLKLRIPLRWLHVHLESQDANNRTRRLKCSTFTQALKDIQRDVIRINGRLYASSCFEDMLSELAIELLQHMSSQTKCSEMDALVFARQLLIHSSRTHGGGDVLDAVHYLLHTPHFCICPEMSHAAPVDIEIQLIDGKTVVEIEMTMVFKLIPTASEHCIGHIIGVSRQRAFCDVTTHFEVDGEILIEVETLDYSVSCMNDKSDIRGNHDAFTTDIGDNTQPTKSVFGTWIDVDTPKGVYNKTTSRGQVWQLVRGDEINFDGRNLTAGEDHLWVALDNPDGVNRAIEVYKPSNAYTKNGTFIIRVDSGEVDISYYNVWANEPGWQDKKIWYMSAMVQTWNKFCIKGGFVEISMKLPRATNNDSLNPNVIRQRWTQQGMVPVKELGPIPDIRFYLMWLGLWMMGNLGRALFAASTNKMWPWTYNECTDLSRANQRISACDPNPGYGLHPYMGRGSPEIDILEGGGTAISSSVQIAPGMPDDYCLTTATMKYENTCNVDPQGATPPNYVVGPCRGNATIPSPGSSDCTITNNICDSFTKYMEIDYIRKIPPILDGSCSLYEGKDAKNEENIYSQNFQGVYCTCHRPYPDPERTEPEVMIQCVVCEDWFHEEHLFADGVPKVPEGGFDECICHNCMKKHTFLYHYVNLPSPAVEGGNLQEEMTCQLPTSAATGAGPTFWQHGWRNQLCKCEKCVAMYTANKINFLTDEDDTLLAYEERAKAQAEDVMDASDKAFKSELSHTQQVEMAMGYEHMATSLKDYLSGFAQSGKTVKAQDIRGFFESLQQNKRQKRE